MLRLPVWLNPGSKSLYCLDILPGSFITVDQGILALFVNTLVEAGFRR